MLKVGNQVTLDDCLNQIRVTLAQQGFKNDGSAKDGLIRIKLEEEDCSISKFDSIYLRIDIDSNTNDIQIDCIDNIALMAKVTEIVKKVLKLI